MEGKLEVEGFVGHTHGATYVDFPFMIALPRNLRMIEPVGRSFKSSSLRSIKNHHKWEAEAAGQHLF